MTTSIPVLADELAKRIIRAIINAGIDGDEAEDLALDMLSRSQEQGLHLSAKEVDQVMQQVDEYR